MQQKKSDTDRYGFGDWVRGYRAEKQITLREFCRRGDVDPGNWSKLERGVMAPPSDKELQRLIVREIIGLDERHPDYYKVFALMDNAQAAISRSEPPHGPDLIGALPMFVTKSDGTRLTAEELDKIVAFVREEETPCEYTDVRSEAKP